jgi:drug/metabolite transporter (DMT)-like permease
MLLPTAFDLFESICRNVSNIMLAPSISQMMRSSLVIFTALLSVIFLKRKLFRHHYVSIAAVVIGLFFVGLSSFLSGSDGNSTRTLGMIALGIILQLIGQCSGATSYILEEKFLGDCDQLTPEELIGWEGFWSILFWIIALPIL